MPPTSEPSSRAEVPGIAGSGHRAGCAAARRARNPGDLPAWQQPAHAQAGA